MGEGNSIYVILYYILYIYHYSSFVYVNIVAPWLVADTKEE
jgi:hypothetical protein